VRVEAGLSGLEPATILMADQTQTRATAKSLPGWSGTFPEKFNSTSLSGSENHVDKPNLELRK
jgi:hypothetical protein